MDEQRLARLLNRYLDGALSAGEKAELERLLLSSPQAREQFWQQAGFHALLREHGEQSWAADLAATKSGLSHSAEPDRRPEENHMSVAEVVRLRTSAAARSLTTSATEGPELPADQELVSPRSGPLHHAFRVAAGPALWMVPGALLGLLLAVAIWHSRPQAGNQDSAPHHVVAAEPTTDCIAVLTQVVQARWDEGRLPLKVGAPLSAGSFKLAGGLAQLEFNGGATVVMEGPAELKLVSASEVYLVRGKLRAEVPPPAQGFVVRCPGADVVDLGTEFGLCVGPEQEAEVHVFDGVVRLYDPGRAAASQARLELTTGCGVRIDAVGEFQDIPADPDGFSDPLDVLEQAESLKAVRRSEWKIHRQRVAADPRLVRYFAFDNDEPWSRQVANAAADSALNSNAAIVGCGWTQGRWLGKNALEFVSISDRVRFLTPGEFDALTLVASLRVDALENRYNSIMMCDDFETGELHWQISQTGEVALGVQGTADSHGVTYRTPGVFAPEKFGQWVQLAVVVDPAAGFVTHYLDGAEIARQPWQQTVKLRIGAAQLGNWGVYCHATPTPIRSLKGRIDEFMIFAAALPPEDLRRVAGLPKLAP